jgi:PAS domain S-box-containing protein
LTVVPPNELNFEIEQGLSRVMELEDADRVCWYVNPEASSRYERRHSVYRPNAGMAPHHVVREHVPWIMERLLRGECVVINRLDDLPPQARDDKQFLQELSTKSVALFPSTFGLGARGLLAMASISEEQHWSADLGRQFGLLSSVIASEVQRKEAQEAQSDSDLRFESLFQSAPIGIALESIKGNIVFVNPALCTILGYEAHELQGKSCSDFSDPEDYLMEQPLLQQLLDGKTDYYRVQKRFHCKNGNEIRARVSVSLLKNRAGEPSLVMGMLEDITEQVIAEGKLSEAQDHLQRLNMRLLKAHDEERHRISRELHDDIAQRLSLLTLDLDVLSQEMTSQPQSLARIVKLRSDTEELATDVHQLSHQLHSSKLQHLGLGAALKDLCKNLSEQQGLKIDFGADARLSSLPSEVELCLFRIAQESLNNVLKHSRSSRAQVQLSEIDGIVQLKVSDEGIGFSSKNPSDGIGLDSMRERLKAVGGQLIIQSAAGRGTQVVAEVQSSKSPLAAAKASGAD